MVLLPAPGNPVIIIISGVLDRGMLIISNIGVFSQNIFSGGNQVRPIVSANTLSLSEKSIVFDATNSSIKKRLEYITVANKYKLPVMCIHVSTPSNIAFKRNRLRMDKKQVPKIAYSVYSKYFNQPTEEEGFSLYVI